MQTHHWIEVGILVLAAVGLWGWMVIHAGAQPPTPPFPPEDPE